MAYFPKIKKIRYEGPDSKNPLAFKWYNEDEIVEGKTMKDHLRFSVAVTIRHANDHRATTAIWHHSHIPR